MGISGLLSQRRQARQEKPGFHTETTEYQANIFISWRAWRLAYRDVGKGREQERKLWREQYYSLNTATPTRYGEEPEVIDLPQ